MKKMFVVIGKDVQSMLIIEQIHSFFDEEYELVFSKEPKKGTREENLMLVKELSPKEVELEFKQNPELRLLVTLDLIPMEKKCSFFKGFYKYTKEKGKISKQELKSKTKIVF
jgi:hypothetical protein